MFRKGSPLFLLAVLGICSPLSAQPKKDAKKEEKKDQAEAKPATPEKDDDVVVDNRDLEKRRALEAQLKEAENPTFENDTPFANTAPDPEGLRAQRWKPGFGGGFRFGFAFPMGSFSGTAKLSDMADGLVFLGGEFGYWPIPQLFAGLALSGGYVLPDCSGNASCSGWEVRGGPLVMWRIQPFRNMSPFIGVGAGYEWMTMAGSTEVTSSRISAHGFELVNLQAGLDVRSRGDFYGVFVSYSIGKFTKESFTVESDTAALNIDRSGDIDDPQTHSWLGIGARGTLE